MPTFIPSHRMLTSTRVLLLSVTFLFGVLFLFSSTVISDDSNEDLLFGTHTDITCPANYQSISSTETGTVCQKNTYVCDPTNSLQRSQTVAKQKPVLLCMAMLSVHQRIAIKRADVMPSDQSKYLSKLKLLHNHSTQFYNANDPSYRLFY